MGYHMEYDKLNTFYLLLWQPLSEVEPLSDENRWLGGTASISKEKGVAMLKDTLEEVRKECWQNTELRQLYEKAKETYDDVNSLIEKYEKYRRKGSSISKEEMSEREQLLMEIAKMKTMLRDKALDFAKKIV